MQKILGKTNIEILNWVRDELYMSIWALKFRSEKVVKYVQEKLMKL